MASKSVAIFLILLFAGHEVLAMRQKVKQRATEAAARDLVKMVGQAKTNAYAGSRSQASCDKDIIVETNEEEARKKVVLASDYKEQPFEVLTKHSNDGSSSTYYLVCADGQAIVRKSSSTNKVSDRPFNAFHWWRDTEIKKDESKIEFKAMWEWESMTSGKVTFTPSGASCEADKEEYDKLGSEIVSMLKENRVRNFRKVSSVLREFASIQQEMKAMSCPSELITVDKSVTEAMQEYFTKNQGGHDAPMADARFTAALEKIQSVSVPTKADFTEVVALMKYGTCPEAKESRVSAARAEELPDELDESRDQQLEDDVASCIADEECGALASQFPADSGSFLQEGDHAVTETKNYVVGFLANFLIFIAILILCIIFWPIAWIFILTWLLLLIVLLPFRLLSGPTIVYDRVTYQIGTFDYLVDEYCRPFIHSSGFPLRKMSNGRNLPAQLAPPVKSYVVYRGGAIYDDITGWPIAMMDDGAVKPLVGLPRPAASSEESE